MHSNPNSSFSTITSVRKAQAKAGRDVDTSSESLESEESGIEDCVFAAGL